MLGWFVNKNRTQNKMKDVYFSSNFNFYKRLLN